MLPLTERTKDFPLKLLKEFITTYSSNPDNISITVLPRAEALDIRPNALIRRNLRWLSRCWEEQLRHIFMHYISTNAFKLGQICHSPRLSPLLYRENNMLKFDTAPGMPSEALLQNPALRQSYAFEPSWLEKNIKYFVLFMICICCYSSFTQVPLWQRIKRQLKTRPSARWARIIVIRSLVSEHSTHPFFQESSVIKNQ